MKKETKKKNIKRLISDVAALAGVIKKELS